jgi:intracellular sulfur oxidation DsrE/DsrF family protein
MKKLILSWLLMSASLLVQSQNVPYNVVFDITSKDTVVHQMVMRWVSEIAKEYPDANLEVVFYGKSLDLVTKDKSPYAADITRLTSGKHVNFTVCEIAMKRNNVEKSQLVTGVNTVPDGIYEIVKRQSDGWAYIKADR